MQVETYECTETASEPIEACEEAIELMEKLGLDGQKKLVSHDTDNERDCRSPYREMTKQEMDVFQELCPDQIELSEYDRSPIPLRVLQVASHAKSLGLFDRFVVWDKRSAEIKDPVLVAEIGKTSFGKKTHILARWGEELDSWPTLVKTATECASKRILSELQDIKPKVDAMIERAKSGGVKPNQSVSFFDF